MNPFATHVPDRDQDDRRFQADLARARDLSRNRFETDVSHAKQYALKFKIDTERAIYLSERDASRQTKEEKKQDELAKIINGLDSHLKADFLKYGEDQENYYLKLQGYITKLVSNNFDFEIQKTIENYIKKILKRMIALQEWWLDELILFFDQGLKNVEEKTLEDLKESKKKLDEEKSKIQRKLNFCIDTRKLVAAYNDEPYPLCTYSPINTETWLDKQEEVEKKFDTYCTSLTEKIEELESNPLAYY